MTSQSRRFRKVRADFFFAASLLLCMTSSESLADRTVMGTITDKNDQPAGNVRVKALDNDTFSGDDEMGVDITDSNGYYEIHYAGGHWDPAWPFSTTWRPDIFIRVSAPVNGWCEDKRWKEDKNWVHRADSGVTGNQRHRDNLTKNLKVNNLPLPQVARGTFTLGQDMWCKVNFFFHTSCFACSDQGKIEWTEWGISGVPKYAERCDTAPLGACSQSDWEKIKNLNSDLSGYPAVDTDVKETQPRLRPQ